MSNRGSLVIISAPSGTGKTSLAERLLKVVPGLHFSVSHTTRKPRAVEKNGVEYFFVSVAEFREMIERGDFLEWACVYGNHYGTSRAAVESRLEAGFDVLLDIDVQGAEKVKQVFPEAISVFVLPPSQDELEKRLRSRGLDDDEVVEARLQKACAEIQRCRGYDYLIVNEFIENSLLELQSIVLAARCRNERRIEKAESIMKTFSASVEETKG